VELHRIAARIINIVEGRVVAPSGEVAASQSSPQQEFELPTRPPRLVAEQS
jgi:hypothetical protein